jgi:hypothetical protein
MTRKHSVSETGYISVFRQGEGETCTVGSFRKLKPQSLETQHFRNRSVFQNVVISNYLEFWMMARVHKPSDSEKEIYLNNLWSITRMTIQFGEGKKQHPELFIQRGWLQEVYLTSF